MMILFKKCFEVFLGCHRMKGAVPIHPEPKSPVKLAQGFGDGATRSMSSPRKKPRQGKKYDEYEEEG